LIDGENYLGDSLSTGKHPQPKNREHLRRQTPRSRQATGIEPVRLCQSPRRWHGRRNVDRGYIKPRRKLSARKGFFPPVPEPDRCSKHGFRLSYEHPILPVSIEIHDQLRKEKPCLISQVPVHPPLMHPTGQGCQGGEGGDHSPEFRHSHSGQPRPGRSAHCCSSDRQGKHGQRENRWHHPMIPADLPSRLPG